MSAPDYFARIRGSVDFPLLQTKRVVIVGVGMVGSPIAEELAKSGIGHLRLIDHDILEKPNLSRHVLTDEYLGWNKAEGLTVYLAQHVEGLQIEAVPRKIDKSVSDNLLDQWFADADLIIAATDDHETQRRVGRRALVHGRPSVFPALYVEGGGEVIVQLDDQLPCFSCWDEFRPPDAPLRGAQALSFTALPIIYTSLRICLGLLDPAAPDRDMMRAGPSRPPYQTFGLNRFGTLLSGHLTRRPNCPSCAVGPPPSQGNVSREPRLPSVVTRQTVRSLFFTSAPEDEPIDEVLRALLWLAVAGAFATAPFVIMRMSGFEKKLNEGGNPLVDLTSIICGFWGIAGLVAVAGTLIVLCMTVVGALATTVRR
jgi:molybdopterin/thiamine biosynthesis adenylyltransferase